MKPLEPEPVVPSLATPTAGARREISNGVPLLTNGNGNGSAPRLRYTAPPTPPAKSIDWAPLAGAVGRHWVWLVLAGVLLAGVGVLLGLKLWATTYSATAQLARFETPDPQVYQPRPISAATLASMIDSTEVRSRVAAKLVPPQAAEFLSGRVRISPERNSDILNIVLTGRDAASAANLANVYANEAIHYTQELQSGEAQEAAGLIRQQLNQVESDIEGVRTKLRALPVSAEHGVAAAPPSVLQNRLEEARLQLADLLGRYTDNHPLVLEQRARVEAYEKQLPAAPKVDPDAPAVAASDYEMLHETHHALESQRILLANRLQVAEMLQRNPPGYYRLFATATPGNAISNQPTLKIALLAFLFGICGVVLAAGGAVTEELCDRRLKTAADVRRVTRLPVIATLGSIDKLTTVGKARWGFRTWTALQSRLSVTPNQGLVCGITSSVAGEGRSVWVKLLAEAANSCGFRVITISTVSAPKEEPKRTTPRSRAANVRFETERGEPKAAEIVEEHETVLSDSLLHEPDAAVEQLLAPEGEGASVVHIPLPGWVWKLERRKEWLAALNTWSAHENIVVLVELPPAATPEAVLLAQNLPNVLWLSDATKAEAPETVRQLETLRHARCNLVGAVVNRLKARDQEPFNERFARWVPAGAAAALALAFAGAPAPLKAQSMADTSSTLSIVSPAQRADWQKELTLGPGDTLRIGLFGEAPTTEIEATVQPDGRISFLEARDVVAAGLTVDELRAKLDAELGQFRRAPRTMVTPVAFRSKRYYMLGHVAQRGTFTLDRPITVVEAVARARGFETGVSGNDVVDMADLSHAFLVRGGHRAHVDFEKLFAEGDLSQNIAVEPGDYFYFPAASQREVYVLGQVNAPGPAVFTDRGTTLSAIAARGGFTDKAWKNRVLVVRGSLSNPQPQVINLADVLAGKAPDIPLEPRDIVYVSARPWWKAEDLLDEAASAFTQSVVVYWTSDKVVPVVPLQ